MVYQLFIGRTQETTGDFIGDPVHVYDPALPYVYESLGHAMKDAATYAMTGAKCTVKGGNQTYVILRIE